MQREAIITALQRFGASVSDNPDLGLLVLNYCGVEVDIQIGDSFGVGVKGRKFARLDSIKDAQGLIQSIMEHRA